MANAQGHDAASPVVVAPTATAARSAMTVSRSSRHQSSTGREVRVDGQFDLHVAELLGLLALELRNGLADETHVEVEADRGDVAGLLAAEQVAGAADLEILHRDLHAGAQVGVLRDCREPV